MVDNGDDNGESKQSSMVNNEDQDKKDEDEKSDGDQDKENKGTDEDDLGVRKDTDGSIPGEEPAKKDDDADGSLANNGKNGSLLGGEAQETVKKTSIMEKLAS
jgi:hypothetical protein